MGYKKLPTPPCWVYVVTDDLWHCKFGIARNPAGRLSELQVGNPYTLRVAGAWRFPDLGQAQYIESSVLLSCFRHRVRGEWVQATPAAACRLVQRKIARFPGGPDSRVSAYDLWRYKLRERFTAISKAGGLRVLEVRA